MQKHKFTLITILLAIILTSVALFYIDSRYRTIIVDIPKFNHQTTDASSSALPLGNKNLKSEISNPKSILLKVPFTPQAPFANWDQIHNESCEEATAYMAYAYFSGQKESLIDPATADKEILRLNDWEKQNFGYNLDTTSAEVAEMINKVYGLQTKLINNFTEADLKNELAQGHLALISEYGRELNNPNYKQPGPIHHMLVIKGYSDASVGTPTSEGASGQSTFFITNDPGTRKGLNYFYDYSTLYSAAGDWDHSTNNVDLNKKIAIAVWK